MSEIKRISGDTVTPIDPSGRTGDRRPRQEDQKKDSKNNPKEPGKKPKKEDIRPDGTVVPRKKSTTGDRDTTAISPEARRLAEEARVLREEETEE